MPIYLALRTAEKAVETETARLALNTPIQKLPLSLLVVLNSLYQTEPVYASNLAKSVGLKATSFTPVIDRLERLGYIKRINDKIDRRAVRLSSTEKGRSIEPHVTHILDQLDIKFKNWKLD